MRKILLFLIVPVFLLSACGQQNIESNISEKVQDFEFTTQDNETLSLQDMEGKWWIADFIFTNCTTVCLPMTSNMKKLQVKMSEEGLEADLVSFTVDPDYDSPEVLKEYAMEYDADLTNWTFLTGYDFETIKEMSISSFKQMLQEPAPGDDQVIHGTRFFLIDPEGTIVKFYNGVEADSIDEIIEDLKIVS